MTEERRAGAARQGPPGAWTQTMLVVLLIGLVLAIAWATQYVMTRAMERPRPAAERR